MSSNGERSLQQCWLERDSMSAVPVESVRLFAPAKLTTSLRVVGRRNDPQRERALLCRLWGQQQQQ
jgi:hypothetical protein